MQFRLTGSVIDASVSRIAASLVPTDQTASVSSIPTYKCWRTNIFPPSRRIAGSDNTIRRCEAATIKPQDVIEKANVCNAPLLPDLHVLWAPCAYINFTRERFEHQTSTREHFFDEKLYRLKIGKVPLVINSRVTTAILPMNWASSHLFLLLLMIFWSWKLPGSLLRRGSYTLVTYHTNYHYPPNLHRCFCVMRFHFPWLYRGYFG